MMKLATILTAVVLTTGCIANEGAELGTNRAALEERPAFPLKLSRVVDESVAVCGSDAWLDSAAYSACVDAGGTSCNKTSCVSKSDKPTVGGNEIAYVEVSYSSIIGPEIAGIIGPEIAGIIGPEMPALASFMANAKTFRVKVLDSYGKTLLTKNGKHYSFASDLETIRSIVKSPSVSDANRVRIYLTY
jgi:hypothetical protein